MSPSRPVPDVPGPGQESVWGYPRPPRVERTDETVEIPLYWHAWKAPSHRLARLTDAVVAAAASALRPVHAGGDSSLPAAPRLLARSPRGM